MRGEEKTIRDGRRRKGREEKGERIRENKGKLGMLSVEIRENLGLTRHDRERAGKGERGKG